jgi:hypothetical protein
MCINFAEYAMKVFVEVLVIKIITQVRRNISVGFI